MARRTLEEMVGLRKVQLAEAERRLAKAKAVKPKRTPSTLVAWARIEQVAQSLGLSVAQALYWARKRDAKAQLVCYWDMVQDPETAPIPSNVFIRRISVSIIPCKMLSYPKLVAVSRWVERTQDTKCWKIFLQKLSSVEHQWLAETDDAATRERYMGMLKAAGTTE